MRLFVGIRIPDNFCGVLKEVCEDLNVDGLKNVSDFHCTLKFLGDVKEKDLGDIKTKLGGVKFKSFEGSFDKIGVFPNEDYMRVVWMGLKPGKIFEEFSEKIEGVLKDFFDKGKKFKAHVTLSRVKFVLDKEKLKEKIDGLKEKNFERKGNFKIENFCLMKSELRKEGAVYEVLEEYFLV